MTPSTKRSFHEVLYNNSQNKNKAINCQQYSRLHVTGPQLAISETTPVSVFIPNSAFTAKDHHFQVALEEALDVFRAVMLIFGYIQTLERCGLNTHQVHPTLTAFAVLIFFSSHRLSLYHSPPLFTQYSKMTSFCPLLLISGDTFTALRQLFNR